MVKRLALDSLDFPHPHEADEHGVVAFGGDTHPSRLLKAYEQGIFPWPHSFGLLWFSPDPRWVLMPSELSINQANKKIIKKSGFIIRTDTHFAEVIRACQKMRSETWITEQLLEDYTELFRQGFAHSVEAFFGDELVGGLYGLSLGRAFFGESKFFVMPNASKIAFVTLVAHLRAWDFAFIDCQAHSHYFQTLGAKPWPREKFLTSLKEALTKPTRLGPWSFFMNAQEALSFLLEQQK